MQVFLHSRVGDVERFGIDLQRAVGITGILWIVLYETGHAFRIPARRFKQRIQVEVDRVDPFGVGKIEGYRIC